MTDDADTDAPDPTASRDGKRRAWEAQMEAGARRAQELLATLKPAPVEVHGVRRRRRRALVRRVRW